MDRLAAAGMINRGIGSVRKGISMATDNRGLGFRQTGMMMTGTVHVEERWCT